MNHYSQALENMFSLMEKPEGEQLIAFRKLALELSKTYPATFNKIYFRGSKKVEETIRDFLRNKERVKAIKYYREISGSGLRDAIVYVDNIKISMEDSIF